MTEKGGQPREPDAAVGTTPGTGVPTGEATRAVHAGLPEAEPYREPLPGPVLAAHYHLPGDPTGADYAYGRDGNPTWTVLERAIAELEDPAGDARAVVFGSGMAAISAALLSLTGPGDTVILPADGYNLLHRVRERLETGGVTVSTVPTPGPEALRTVESATDLRMLWLETPSNPGLDVCDVRELAAAAHARGALVAVDNTLATPLGQRPLELGADLSVASGTKALNGHGDVLLGYVAARDASVIERVVGWRKIVGAIPGPMEAWLVHRGLATLELRTSHQQTNALAVAEALLDEAARRGDVTGVRYPGRPGDPAHDLAARQMRRFGCVIGFTLPDRGFAERFLGALRIVEEATSFGGVRSTAERRGRWTTPDGVPADAVAEGFVRMSLGVEDPADLVADVRRALEIARGGA
ncbi:cystathionine gamma-lyase [Streptomyces alkaliphilus]|uniref:cystathionine gamma-lyase n=1 Tax=Streptomyces alkaliphilus TaxID=1472722 RepID=UPI00117D9BBC|nr:cystathionine gamma-lyase [Streptomyces alkaliphilus]MQS08584.1 cystathionine gamma-lyase [Streptomyces alkaliphilus]